jgi:hypothetical protein
MPGRCQPEKISLHLKHLSLLPLTFRLNLFVFNTSNLVSLIVFIAFTQQCKHNQLQGLALVEANDEEIVYEITFDLPDASLPMDDKGAELADSRDDTVNTPVVPKDDTANVGEQRYPTQACRSVVGN